MNQGKRLLFYIALNIMVSACTTLAVLWVWDRQQQTPVLASLGGALTQPTSPGPVIPTSGPTQAPAETVPASPQAVETAGEPARLVVIDNVFGIGNLKAEYVLLKRTGEGEIVLTNWRLEDGSGNTYTFPALTLYANGAVQLHTAAGANSVVDLYWGRDAAVWEIGKTVSLYDDQGKLRATYRIP
jgi:hypothetical protein